MPFLPFPLVEAGWLWSQDMGEALPSSPAASIPLRAHLLLLKESPLETQLWLKHEEQRRRWGMALNVAL